MQTKVFGCALDGLQATTVTIELNLDNGNHRVISGLPDDAIKESMASIEAAIVNTTPPAHSVLIAMIITTINMYRKMDFSQSSCVTIASI